VMCKTIILRGMNLIKRFLRLAIFTICGLSLTNCNDSSLRSDPVNAPQDEQTKAYSIVREREPDENGAATLATIVRYYHMSENLDQVDRLIPTRDGTASLLSLKQAAEKLGFSTRAVKGNCEALLKVTLPIIAHEQTQAEQKDKHPGHFVVIFDVDRTSVVVGNTSDGVIQKRPRHQFCQTWTGSLLLLESKQPR
jgi:ATP-binding cassette, subfamily C, bacteriocin exporter